MFHPHTVLDEVYSKGHAQSDLSWERCREVRSVKNSPYRDDVVGVPFSFVTVVDMAPLALRREAFDDVGARTRPVLCRRALLGDVFLASVRRCAAASLVHN